jgi:hypothetical protein
LCPQQLQLVELELFSYQQALGNPPGAFPRLWSVFMSISAFSAVVLDSGWVMFWGQLPLLVLALAVIVVATTALRRARPQDVPRVFEAFAAAFGRRGGPPRFRKGRKGEGNSR